MNNVQARSDAPEPEAGPPLVLELTVKQLLELDDEGQRLVGRLVNSFWEKQAGVHHPYYHEAHVARLGPDYDVNGYGERAFGGAVAEMTA